MIKIVDKNIFLLLYSKSKVVLPWNRRISGVLLFTKINIWDSSIVLAWEMHLISRTVAKRVKALFSHLNSWVEKSLQLIEVNLNIPLSSISCLKRTRLLSESNFFSNIFRELIYLTIRSSILIFVSPGTGWELTYWFGW